MRVELSDKSIGTAIEVGDVVYDAPGFEGEVCFDVLLGGRSPLSNSVCNNMHIDEVRALRDHLNVLLGES